MRMHPGTVEGEIRMGVCIFLLCGFPELFGAKLHQTNATLGLRRINDSCSFEGIAPCMLQGLV
jgi:hypothetical protein